MKDLVSFLIITLFTICALSAQVFERASFQGILNNQELAHPFLGGLNNPFVQTIDLDQDGQDEIWLMDRSGEVSLIYRFVNGSWIYDEDLSRDLPVLNDWLIIQDFNRDGLSDLFTNSLVQGVAGISVYYGMESPEGLKFTFADFPQFKFSIISYESRPGQFTNAYVAPGDLPAIGDADYDGDIDILGFEPGGLTIHFYKNTQVEDGLSPDRFHYILEDVCWGKVVEDGLSATMILGDDTIGCGNSFHDPLVEIRHAGSSMMFLERNGDRRMDLLVGDIGSTSLLNLLNDGTTRSAFVTQVESQFPVEAEPIAIPIFPYPMQADYDQDGITDFLASPGDIINSENVENLWLYRNEGNDSVPVYNLIDKHVFGKDMFDFGSLSVPAIIDYNGDGLNDIIVGTRGVFPAEILSDSRLVYLKNNGQGGFILEDDDLLNFSKYQTETAILSPATGDLDGDGDMDIMVGEGSGRLIYVENIAGPNAMPSFANPILPYEDIDVGVQSHPAIFDVNSDGLMDLVVGERNGNLNYFQNIGTSENPQFNTDPDNDFFGEVDVRVPGFVSGSSTPLFLKTEIGNLLIAGSQSGPITIYDPVDLNGNFPIIDSLWGGILEGDNTSVALGDLDGDNTLEAVVGNQRGGLSIYETGLPDMTSTTSIPSESANHWDVYPNPTTSTLNIQSSSVDNEVQLFHCTGTLVYTGKGTEHFQIDVTSFPRGTYIIMLQNEDGISFEKILIL